MLLEFLLALLGVRSGVHSLKFKLGKHHFLVALNSFKALMLMDDLHDIHWDFGVFGMIELFLCFGSC